MLDHLDTVLTARIDFAVTVSFYFKLPSFSMEIASFLVVLEGVSNPDLIREFKPRLPFNQRQAIRSGGGFYSVASCKPPLPKRQTAAGAGVDFGRLDQDLAARAAELDAALARVNGEAHAIG